MPVWILGDQQQDDEASQHQETEDVHPPPESVPRPIR